VVNNNLKSRHDFLQDERYLAEKELLSRLAAHPILKKSPHSVALLDELHKSTWASNGSAVEQLITQLFEPAGGGKPLDPPKALGRLRTLVYRVRSAIEEIYGDPASEFQHESRPEIEIKGQMYLLRFNPGGARPYLTAFWKPYLLCGDKERQIQTSDRFFLRLGSHLYFRDVTSPDWPSWPKFLSSLCEELKIDVPPFDPTALKKLERDLVADVAARLSSFLQKGKPELTPEDVLNGLRRGFHPVLSRHYVSAGEAVGLTHMAELFQSFQKPVVFGNRPGTTTDNELANIVQVGKPRPGSELSRILDKQKFRVGQDEITHTEHREVKKDQPHSHADEPTVFRSGLGASAPAEKFALVTRCPNAREPYVITSVGASHGRVTEAVCRYLVEESSVASLFDRFGWELKSPPASFQFVLKLSVHPGSSRERTSATVVGLEPEWWDWA
jgi:hypothetical protein